MSTCHQAHNIPWAGLLEVLHKVPAMSTYYFERRRQYDVHDLIFTPDEKGVVNNKLQFFARKFEAAIREFSKTERLKYRNDELDKLTEICELEGCNEYLGEQLQMVSGWFKDDRGDLDAMKELFIKEKAASLLCLARKGIAFENYQFVTYSNFFHYGLGRIKEDCLTLYIHLNLLLATGTLHEPNQWYGQWQLFLDREILTRYDGNSHARMYKEYFVNNPKFQDMDGLQDLLKKLFRTMYLYDMVFLERGVKISWESEVLSFLGYFLNRNKSSRDLWCNFLESKQGLLRMN